MNDGAKFLILCWAAVLLLGLSGPVHALATEVLAWICIAGLFVMFRALVRIRKREGRWS